MTPTPNTARYEKLASFLMELMENPKASKRVRLSAALRLDDLLARQERREAAEGRRQERTRLEAAKAQEKASQRETPPTAEIPQAGAERDRVAEQALDHLQKILQKS